MKSRTVIWAAGLACVATLAIAQLSPAVVGKWQGDNQGSPCVTLNVVREKNGELSGRAVFFSLDAPQKVLGKQEVQLIDPKLEGNAFSFKVRNQQGRVTMNPSSGETIGFQMTLNSDSEGLLKSDDPAAPSVKLLKQK